MHISELETETLDLDWFAIDEEKFIGHFATGGFGALPNSAKSSLEDLRLMTEYFTKVLAPITAPIANPALGSQVSLRDELAEAKYLQDFMAMASRGIFSFDHLHKENRSTGYFQVAKPSLPLHVTSLPQEIRLILEKTVIERAYFRMSNEIDAKTIR